LGFLYFYQAVAHAYTPGGLAKQVEETLIKADKESFSELVYLI
jgi:hypothetical protein